MAEACPGSLGTCSRARLDLTGWSQNSTLSFHFARLGYVRFCSKPGLCRAPGACSEKQCPDQAWEQLPSVQQTLRELLLSLRGFLTSAFLALQEHPPAINHLDSSSNPSSTTSSTPSSPAPFQSSNPPSATPPPNPSPMGQRDARFNFPGKTALCKERLPGIHRDLQVSEYLVLP